MADDPMADLAKPKEKGKGKWYKQNIGPLPAGVWVIVVGVGVGYQLYKRKYGGVSTATATAPETVDLTTADPTVGNMGSGGGGGGGGGITTPGITDNTAWYQAGMRWALGHGYDPTVTDQALRNYMEGNTLTAAQNAIVQAVLLAIGPLPQPPPPSVDPPAVTPPPPGTPAPPPPPPTPVTPPAAVSNFQTRLNRMADAEGFVTRHGGPMWPHVAITGVIDGPTQEAIKAFQRSTTPPIPQTGQMDTLTTTMMTTAEAVFHLGAI